ncbi:MAG: endonuclease/exonuclease/phosphatase family protein [Phycisphaerales bacterium]
MIARLPILLPVLMMLFVMKSQVHGQDIALRAMTFNLEDVRYHDLMTTDNPKLSQIAETIQRLRPNILLINEIETNQDPNEPTSAELFIRNYLNLVQTAGVDPIDFNSLTPATNTGIASGHDLDNSGEITTEIPERATRQTPEQRAYGGDSFGFGGFPGQYGMAILVDPQLVINRGDVRSFQKFLWKDLPEAQSPTLPDGASFYSSRAWNTFRLSSKNFVDVPVQLPNGKVIHCLISHPTPPAFDGPEKRNKLRNRDEIRLIREYVDGSSFLYDDDGQSGGLPANSSFLILGDLNADPVDGSSVGDPIGQFLLSSDRIGKDPIPVSSAEIDRLDPADTSMFGLRVDYVLGSADITVLTSGIWRYDLLEPDAFPSDHFPVWADLLIPAR